MSRKTFATTVLAGMLLLAPTLPAHAKDNLESWKNTAHSKYSVKKNYPLYAAKNGIEGQAKVLVNVAESGLVKGVSLFETSGNEILDKQAMKIALSVNDLPALPEGYSEHSLIVPITFKIEG